MKKESEDHIKAESEDLAKNEQKESEDRIKAEPEDLVKMEPREEDENKPNEVNATQAQEWPRVGVTSKIKLEENETSKI